MAKIFAKVNAILVSDGLRSDAVAIILKRLLTGDCHHELLIYEAMLALTNLAACEDCDFKDRIVTEGGFRFCFDFLDNKNDNA